MDGTHHVDFICLWGPICIQDKVDNRHMQPRLSRQPGPMRIMKLLQSLVSQSIHLDTMPCVVCYAGPRDW